MHEHAALFPPGLVNENRGAEKGSNFLHWAMIPWNGVLPWGVLFRHCCTNLRQSVSKATSGRSSLAHKIIAHLNAKASASRGCRFVSINFVADANTLPSGSWAIKPKLVPLSLLFQRWSLPTHHIPLLESVWFASSDDWGRFWKTLAISMD